MASFSRIALLLSFLTAVVFGGGLFSAVGLMLGSFLIGHFLDQSRKEHFDFPAIIMLGYGIQLLVAPFFAYHVIEPHWYFRPLISAEDYYGFMLPCMFSFVAGLYLVRPKKLPVELHLDGVKRMRGKLLLVAWCAYAVLPYMPGSVRFVAALLTDFGMVVAFAELADERRRMNWRIFFLGCVPVVLSSLQQGIFYHFIVWGVWCFPAFMRRFGVRDTVRAGALFACVVAGVFVIDGAKRQYRERLMLNLGAGVMEKVTILVECVVDEVMAPGNQQKNEGFSQLRMTRLNQGALVTWIMAWVPDVEPHAEGMTIVLAARDSFVPRYLMPNKEIAGGAQKFERYTGRELLGTNMNLSIPGEMWVNFGWSGWMGMFPLGWFLALLSRRVTEWLAKRDVLAFLPLIFLVWCKGEDDLVTPLNHTFKAIVLVVGMLWLLRVNGVGPESSAGLSMSSGHQPLP